MSGPPVSLAFFDPARRRHGTLRSGFTLLFADGAPSPVPEGAEVATAGDGYTAVLPGRLELSFVPVAPPARLGGASARVCRVEGSVGEIRIDCLGTAVESTQPPAWGELDALRAISALFARDTAVLALARRPRGAPGHGDELVTAALVTAGEAQEVDRARVSTVYDADGRQRSAGLELWLPGEDFPRRASGTAAAGTTLDLDGLRVHVAVFDWEMAGRAGAGAYELTVRRDEPAAA